MSNGPHDEANADLAARLVRAGLGFFTAFSTTPDRAIKRLFNLPFDSTSRPGEIINVVVQTDGGLMTAFCPVRVSHGTDPVVRRKDLLADIVTRQALVRLWPDAGRNPNGDDIIWIEAEMPLGPAPSDRKLAIAPVGAVIAAAELMLKENQDLAPIEVTPEMKVPFVALEPLVLPT